MHPADVLVIGPLGPLVPRPVRVRLGLAAAGVLGLLTAAALLLTWRVGWLPTGLPTPFVPTLPQLAPGGDAPTNVTVVVASQPSGATILAGGRELGRTPAAVSIATGEALVLRRDGFLDAVAVASGPRVEVALWRAQPDTQLVRPPVPGARVSSADFLPDGRVALAVEVPPNGERQPWAYDPVRARLERLGQAPAPGALPSAVAIAPDGQHMAAILRLDGLDGAAADQLSIEGPEGARQPLSSAATGERLLDVSWSPLADSVLVLSERQVPGGRRFHLRLVGVGTEGLVRDMADLPGEPVAGSWAWAPNGQSVAFLVRGSATALVALDTVEGQLRYLSDLRPDALPGQGAVAPATWAPSGDLLYAAPVSGGFAARSNDAAPVLFGVGPGRIDAHRLGDIQPVWAPTMSTDGVVLTLARGDNDALVLRPVDLRGRVLAEQRLGVAVPGAFAARWDLGHRQLLIMRGAPTGGVDVLLLRFGASDAPAGGDVGAPSGSMATGETTPEGAP